MTPGGIPVRRVGWLDGLRGIAALQVLLLHYASAFQPAIGLRLPTLMHNRWEAAFIHTPLFFPFDGYTAVYVFFLISGVVLTQAFERMPLAMATGILRRVVRLGLPMVAALAFGALLFALMPAANLAAAEQSGSRTWLGAGGPSEVSLLSLAHQAAFEGMFVGYGGVSLLPGWLGLLMGIVPHMRSFDVPLWTLHVEFYGSLIVLLLVALRAVASRRLYLTSCLALGLLWVPSPLVLFIIGHLGARWINTVAAAPRRPAWGVVLLAVGILICTAPPVRAFGSRLPVARLGPAIGPETLQSMAGAVLICAGIALLPIARNVLQAPVARWLGRISFSLYLVHFPLIWTVACVVFVIAVRYLPYEAAVLVVSVGGVIASFTVAVIFERLIDRPAIAVSRMIQPTPLAAPASTLLRVTAEPP